MTAPVETDWKPNKGKELGLSLEGKRYLRLPIKTRLITKDDTLDELVDEYITPHVRPGDLVFISEKIVATTQGRIIRIKDVNVSPLAKLLAGKVRNHVNTDKFRGFGHGTGPAMQLFIEEAGVPRVLFATAVSAITRPLGIKGMFYRVSGKRAKSVDCPMSFDLYPYTEYAKRAPLDPSGVARKVKEKTGCDTVIVDANYRGAFSLGSSNQQISEKFIQALLRDNPAGQADEMTPFFLIRE